MQRFVLAVPRSRKQHTKCLSCVFGVFEHVSCSGVSNTRRSRKQHTKCLSCVFGVFERIGCSDVSNTPSRVGGENVSEPCVCEREWVFLSRTHASEPEKMCERRSVPQCLNVICAKFQVNRSINERERTKKPDRVSFRQQVWPKPAKMAYIRFENTRLCETELHGGKAPKCHFGACATVFTFLQHVRAYLQKSAKNHPYWQRSWHSGSETRKLDLSFQKSVLADSLTVYQEITRKEQWHTCRVMKVKIVNASLYMSFWWLCEHLGLRGQQ